MELDVTEEYLAAEEPLPVRMVAEFVYCPRLFHIEHVQGLFEENVHTVEGDAEHDRQRPKTEPADGGSSPWPASPRRLHLSDDRRGIVGILDAIECEDGMLVPVDYKHGSAPPDDYRGQSYLGIPLGDGAWPNDQVQLCAQGFLVEADGSACTHGYLYYRKSQKRVRVEFTDALRRATEAAIAGARETAGRSVPPLPLADSPKCIGCSLVGICLPDETLLLAGETDEEPRPLAPSRDDARILYVTGQGTRIRRRGECIVIEPLDAPPADVPLLEIAHTAVFGNVQITTQALADLVADGRTVAYFTTGGWLRAIAHDFSLPNVRARIAQFTAAANPAERLRHARAFVAAKVHNQRVLLTRNSEVPKATADELRDLVARAEECDDMGVLLGLEGRAAAIYFGSFADMLKPELRRFYDMKGRNRRPPTDPVNAMLSFGYAVLVRDAYAALVRVGLDPLVGYLHSPRAGRPGLALDMMEPYRPLVVDSAVLRALNTGEVEPKHFDIYPRQVAMTQAGRKAFLGAYQRRMDELIRHPDFEYSMSYRRVLAVECRLLANVLAGDRAKYRPLRTR